MFKSAFKNIPFLIEEFYFNSMSCYFIARRSSPVRFCSINSVEGENFYPGTDISLKEAWRRRVELRKSMLQREEQVLVFWNWKFF